MDSPSGGSRRAGPPRRKGRPRTRSTALSIGTPPSSGGVSGTPPSSGGVSGTPPSSGGVSGPLSAGGASGTPASSGGVSGKPPSGGGAPKRRGRPPGSRTKKEKGVGVGFTVHIITVYKGQDICSAIEEFSSQLQRRVVILTANGVVSSVTLFHFGESSEVGYNGAFFILSLSCSVGESGISGFTLSFCGSAGKVYAGEVVGSLIAASPIQITLGSFVDEVKQGEGSSSAPPPGSSTGEDDPKGKKPKTSPPPPPSSSTGEDDPKGKKPMASPVPPPGSSAGEDDPKGKKPMASPVPPPGSSTGEDDPQGKKPMASPAPSPLDLSLTSSSEDEFAIS